MFVSMEKDQLQYGKYYRPSRYAKGIGVHPSLITALFQKGRLIVNDLGYGIYLVLHCKENNKQFPTKDIK